VQPLAWSDTTQTRSKWGLDENGKKSAKVTKEEEKREKKCKKKMQKERFELAASGLWALWSTTRAIRRWTYMKFLKFEYNKTHQKNHNHRGSGKNNFCIQRFVFSMLCGCRAHEHIFLRYDFVWIGFMIPPRVCSVDPCVARIYLGDLQGLEETASFLSKKGGQQTCCW
jgi:hypothetical protein